MKRPVTGRNAFVEIEGEDYDGQSGVTKEDSDDTTRWGSRSPAQRQLRLFENVDFSDAGVSAVQLRVNAQSATTLELRADSQTGALLGRRARWPHRLPGPPRRARSPRPATGVAACMRSWRRLAPQLAEVRSGYDSTGAGGAGGGAGGAAGGAAAARAAARREVAAARRGGAGGSASAGSGGGANGVAGGGANGGTGGGANGGTGGGVNGGTGGNSNGGSGGGGNSGAGGTTSGAGGGEGSGCSCQVGNARGPSATLLVIGLVAVVLLLSQGPCSSLVAPRRRRGVRLLFFQVAALPRFARERPGTA